MSNKHLYAIRRVTDAATGKVIFEVWGGTADTGYEWLIAVRDTRDEAVALIASWREVGE